MSGRPEVRGVNGKDNKRRRGVRLHLTGLDEVLSPCNAGGPPSVEVNALERNRLLSRKGRPVGAEPGSKVEGLCHHLLFLHKAAAKASTTNPAAGKVHNEGARWKGRIPVYVLHRRETAQAWSRRRGNGDGQPLVICEGPRKTGDVTSHKAPLADSCCCVEEGSAQGVRGKDRTNAIGAKEGVDVRSWKERAVGSGADQESPTAGKL